MTDAASGDSDLPADPEAVGRGLLKHLQNCGHPPQPADSDAAALLHYVHSHLACTSESTRLATGLSRRQFKKVLGQLLSAGQIVEYHTGRSHHLFIARPGIQEQMAILVAWANPTARLLYGEIARVRKLARQDFIQFVEDRLELVDRSADRWIRRLMELDLIAVEHPSITDQRTQVLMARDLPNGLSLEDAEFSAPGAPDITQFV